MRLSGRYIPHDGYIDSACHWARLEVVPDSALIDAFSPTDTVVAPAHADVADTPEASAKNWTPITSCVVWNHKGHTTSWSNLGNNVSHVVKSPGKVSSNM
jgi:hypothetical protein